MKTIKLTFLAIATFLLLITTSCVDNYFSIHGNGIEESEFRYAENFSKVKSSGSFEVFISNGDEYEVVVNAESNILPYIETNVHGNSLSIGLMGIHIIKNTLPMEVYITTPVLKELKESGSGIITTDFFTSNNFSVSVSGSGIIETAVDCNNFNANISGSGIIYVSGNSNNANLNISGSGKIDNYDFNVTDCYANISGSGDIFVSVERMLDATVSGSGNIFYIGEPDIIHHVSGSGKIINDNDCNE